MKRSSFIKQSSLLGLSWHLPGWVLDDRSAFLKVSPCKTDGGSSFDFFSIDSLGKNDLSANVILPAQVPGAGSWALDTRSKSFSLSSQYHYGYTRPFVFNIDQQANHATLLGMMKGEESTVSLPAILHFPDMGTLRVTCNVPGQKVDYHAMRFIDHPYVRMSFPAATFESPAVTYHFEVVSIHPPVKGIENDARYDCFRKNFISIFQLNPFLKVLANNSASDACVFTLYLYAEVARHTPPLAKDLTALDLIRMSLDRYLGGQKGYGLLGYDYDKTWDLPESPTECNTLDSYPSLLISVCHYMEGSGDKAWLMHHSDKISVWADKMLKTDVDGDGLIEFCLSGNSGSWKGDKTMRPANWWDVIGFGYKDAYSNALAYRALVMLTELFGHYPEKAALFGEKAALLKEAYVRTFYNPSTHVLAGWKSEDGVLHDYFFIFINSMAICHGLVEPTMANQIMDTLLQKMKEVGFTDFGLGLPGNLIPVKRSDYTDLLLEVGGGKKEDNTDGFQIYENGGASACFVYYTVTALQQLGRQKDADDILLPLLKSMSEGDFQGRCPSGRTKDWKTWKGECWGYEGFLVDNYMFLLSVLGRHISMLLILLIGFFLHAAAQNEATQRFTAGPLSLVSYGMKVRLRPSDSSGYSFIRFYNQSDSLLLEYRNHLTPSDTGSTSAGDYTETPPATSYLTVGATVNMDDLHVERNIGANAFVPRIDVDQYLKPFWKSDTIVNETVLLLSENGHPARGRLLFMPSKVLSVRSFDLNTRYITGRDYSLNGNTLTRLEGSSMSFRADTSFDTKTDLAWFNLQSQWVVVTYIHREKWTGPLPRRQGNRLPGLMAKLARRAPVTIVAYGMSITRGMDVSGYDGVPPYTPNYMDLMVHGLRKRYHYDGITLFNAGLPGSTVAWGAQYTAQYVNPLHPDLVVVDFGMNDFWKYTPDEFRGYIQTILHKVRASNPSVEFLLVSNMQFDPAYILDTDKYKTFYIRNMQGYHAVLSEMAAEGIAVLDMNTLSDYLYTRKKAKDCIVNPLHPNDYLSRWYAQSLLEVMER